MKQKFPAWIFIIIVVMGICCTERRPFIDKTVPTSDKAIPKTKPASSYNDTITITSKSAVFYNPDSVQLREIKSNTDSQVFEGIMHECFYQEKNARQVLKREYPGIKIIVVKNARFLHFRKENNETEVIDLNGKNDPCGLFLFDRIHSPHVTDMTNIESELGFYFSKNRGR